MARIADLFSSSCFSYSCFTEFALTLDVQVYFNGSTILSNPETGNKKKLCEYIGSKKYDYCWELREISLPDILYISRDLLI